MNITAITPTRGDRPQFVENCIRMMQRQTVKLYQHLIIDYAPINDRHDIGARYKEGFEQAFTNGADIVFCIEDDDWYKDDYIEKMMEGWKQAQKPSAFGFQTSMYYHIPSYQYVNLRHPGRASMYNSLFDRSVLSLNWPDDMRFLDIFLWKNLSGVSGYAPSSPVCIGIKHGIGMAGGSAHSDMFRAWERKDKGHEQLRKWMATDEEGLKFYLSL